MNNDKAVDTQALLDDINGLIDFMLDLSYVETVDDNDNCYELSLQIERLIQEIHFLQDERDKWKAVADAYRWGMSRGDRLHHKAVTGG